MKPRLKNTYEHEIINKLMSKLSLKNKHEVPKIDKIILNMGLGEDASDGKKLKACVDDMSLISGQKPVVTKFKKSISNFKTRKGGNAGVKVTLRSTKMYEFIDRLVNIALPRVKDFRGLSSKGIDKTPFVFYKNFAIPRLDLFHCFLMSLYNQPLSILQYQDSSKYHPLHQINEILIWGVHKQHP